MFEFVEKVIQKMHIFFGENEVFYIGGADVLPPPLEKEEENRCILALEEDGNQEPDTRENKINGACGFFRRHLCGGFNFHRYHWPDQGNQHL